MNIPSPLANNEWMFVKNMSDVAMRFKQMNDPTLKQIGHELEPATFEHPDGVFISTDLVACLLRLNEICEHDGTFKRGSNATIAECIFGDRTKSGGSFYRQIKEVKGQLEDMFTALKLLNSTTTELEPEPTIPALVAA